VRSAKVHCKRGERKVAWVVAGSSSQSQSQSAAGQQGSSGATGTNGSQGSTGSTGAQGSGATLSTEVATLNLKLEALENVLKGVTNGDLTGALGKLNGVGGGELSGALNTVKGLTNGELTGALDAVQGLTNGELTGALDTVQGLTNTDLTEAVDMVPVVGSLCTQTSALTGNLDALGSAVKGLGLNQVLKLLNGALEITGVPNPLGTFGC
jgi:collagen type I alpha